MRAQGRIEETARATRDAIIVTELPYQVNKATLIEKIAELVRDKKIDGISDLRDESDRHGMRIVIELKRDAQPRKVLNSLYKHTAHAVVLRRQHAGAGRRQPRTLTLKQVPAALHRAPPGRHHAPHRVRARKARDARPHPRRL